LGAQRRPAIVRAFAELKRRRVFGAVAAYVLLAALLIELSGAIFEALLFPDWTPRLVTTLLILGLPVVAVLSWFFDLSTGGLERTSRGAKSDDSGGLAEALGRSRGSPVPDGPVRRRRRAGPVAEADATAPDPDRVRAATLGHMRHELRTPINGIIGYSEMLLEDVDDPALAADLERIRRAGRQLLERVDAVLSPEGPGDGVLDDLEAFAARVRLDLRTPVSAVVGYAEMLEESFEEAGRADLMDDLERILTSARRLLELSDDIVRLATRTGAGAGITAASSAMTQEVLSKIRPVGAGDAAPEGQGRLLVVDDNETNRDLISRQLARFGYTVATAPDGQAALDRLEEQDFDLILLDVIMPRLDGVATLARLQADERLADVPVIMLSSLDELDSAVRCIDMGATDYIAKPAQPTLLEARIAAALELRDLRSREHAYRRRVDSDAVLIDRLISGSFPAFVRERVRDGALGIRETYPATTVVRAVYPTDSRPSSGADGLDRIEAVQRLAGLAEEVAAEHEADGLIWRADGFVVVFQGDPERSVPAAAAFALAAGERLDGVAVGMHAGALVAGVVGDACPRFEVWGEALEGAEALAASAAGGILITPAVHAALGAGYEAEARGVKEVRGRGQMRVYSLTGTGTGSGSGATGLGVSAG